MMAVLYCWASGMLGISNAAAQPEGTVTILTGIESKLRSEMVALAELEPRSKQWYVPNMLGMPSGEGAEDIKIKIVESFSNRLLARRFRHKGRVVHNSDE